MLLFRIMNGIYRKFISLSFFKSRKKKSFVAKRRASNQTYAMDCETSLAQECFLKTLREVSPSRPDCLTPHLTFYFLNIFWPHHFSLLLTYFQQRYSGFLKKHFWLNTFFFQIFVWPKKITSTPPFDNIVKIFFFSHDILWPNIFSSSASLLDLELEDCGAGS